jgi:cell cycle checkpoint protein
VCRYKYKFLRATTSQIPNSILKDNRGSKVTIGSTGLLKVQHLISVRPTHAQQHHYMDPSQVHARVSYIEFYVMPDEDDNNEGTQ